MNFTINYDHPERFTCRPAARLRRSGVTPQEIQQGIDQLGPWFYPFEFGGGLRTTALVPPAVTEIFDTGSHGGIRRRVAFR